MHMTFLIVWIGSFLTGLAFLYRAWREKEVGIGPRIAWVVIGTISLGCFYFLTVDLSPKYVRWR
jgi:hypothetical protein